MRTADEIQWTEAKQVLTVLAEYGRAHPYRPRHASDEVAADIPGYVPRHAARPARYRGCRRRRGRSEPERWRGAHRKGHPRSRTPLHPRGPLRSQEDTEHVAWMHQMNNQRPYPDPLQVRAPRYAWPVPLSPHI